MFEALPDPTKVAQWNRFLQVLKLLQQLELQGNRASANGLGASGASASGASANRASASASALWHSGLVKVCPLCATLTVKPKTQHGPFVTCSVTTCGHEFSWDSVPLPVCELVTLSLPHCVCITLCVSLNVYHSLYVYHYMCVSYITSGACSYPLYCVFVYVLYITITYLYGL